MSDPRSTDESLRPILASIEATRRRMEESPHQCIGGCGERVVRAGLRCEGCSRAHERENAGRARVEATTANMPNRYRWSSFSASELPVRVRDKTAIAKATSAAMNPNIDRIVFAGVAGAGKTSLAVACAKVWASWRHITGHFVTARELSLARSQTSLGQEPSVVSSAVKAGILIVDDLGLDDPTQYGSAVLDVIYSRFSHVRPTIITLAIKVAELEDGGPGRPSKYGVGVARRLLENDGATMLIDVRRLGVAPGGSK